MANRLLLWAFLVVPSLGLSSTANSAVLKAVPENVKVLILPGFGNDSIDYTIDRSLVSSLEERGWKKEQIRVLPVERFDWLQVFLRGLLDWKFWVASAAPTRPAFRWYLDRIAQEIAELKDDEKIILLGHSAGGWLGRAAVGFGSEDEDASVVDLTKVVGIVTLGAPNLPPPEGVMDMTRGALRITNERFPGAYHAPSIFYITALGLAVKGEPQAKKTPMEPTTLKGFAFNSYAAVCGDGTTIGDGVVPQCSGHLEDAIQVCQIWFLGCPAALIILMPFIFQILKLDLDGVLHSINARDNWYGASRVLDTWHAPMLQELSKSLGRKVESWQ